MSNGTIVLSNTRLVLADRVIERGWIRYQGATITGVGEGSLNEGEAVNLGGTTIFPGFIDVHIHGAVGIDTLNATAADLLKVSRF